MIEGNFSKLYNLIKLHERKLRFVIGHVFLVTKIFEFWTVVSLNPALISIRKQAIECWWKRRARTFSALEIDSVVCQAYCNISFLITHTHYICYRYVYISMRTQSSNREIKFLFLFLFQTEVSIQLKVKWMKWGRLSRFVFCVRQSFFFAYFVSTNMFFLLGKYRLSIRHADAFVPATFSLRWDITSFMTSRDFFSNR